MSTSVLSKLSTGRVPSFLNRLAALLAVSTVLAAAATAGAGQFYANGNNINLASGRSNTFSSSGTQSGLIQSPLYPQYAPKEYRVVNSVDGPYWQVNFPQGYEVSSAYVETHEAPYAINTIDVHTTTDGINWINQGTSPVVVHNGSGNKINFTFPTVSNVTGVRLVSSSFDDPGYPGIFRAIRITGPNTSLPVNDAPGLFSLGKSEFSVLQSTWNGATVQSAPGWGRYNDGANPLAVIDDYTEPTWNYNQTIFRSAGPGDPAPIDILLNDNYLIDSVAVVVGVDGRSTTQVDISYSTDSFGAFIPILTNVNLTGNALGYYNIPLGGLFDSRRLRFDFNASGNAEATFIAELYAFASFTAVPEPTTLSLLGLGLVGLAVKNRRRRKQAA